MLCCVSERPEMLEGCLVECVAILASTRSAPTYEYPDMPTRDATANATVSVLAVAPVALSLLTASNLSISAMDDDHHLLVTHLGAEKYIARVLREVS